MKKLTIIGARLIESGTSQQIEEQFELKLPTYFKEFINQYSGASIYENWVKEDVFIGSIMTLYSKDNISMEMAIEQVRYYDEREEESIGRYDLIPFALASDLSYFCLSVGEEDYGCVYHTEWDKVNHIPLVKYADSFEDFINNLSRNEKNDRETYYTKTRLNVRVWIANCFINKDYKEGIKKVKTDIEESTSFGIEDLKALQICIEDKRIGFEWNTALDIFQSLGIHLRKATEEEAFKWIELLLHNIELEDESQIIEYPLRRTEQETATLIGGGYAYVMITSFYYFQDYKKAISKIKLDLKEAHHLQAWNYLKQAVSEQCLDAYKDSDLNVWYKDALSIFHQARVRLREDTEAEAYRWLELLIRNVELEDESQIIEYPLEII